MKKAVAVRYATGLPAPLIVAKGADEVARRVMEIASASGVQILEAPALADSLFTLDVGEWIPEELYAAMAEILSFVYRIRARR